MKHYFSATNSDLMSTNELSNLFHVGLVYDDFGYKNCISSSDEEETPLSLKKSYLLGVLLSMFQIHHLQVYLTF